MKLTRRKLSHLISEALKPFFMGVEPTNLITRLRNDPDIDPRAKKLLNHNEESQRSAISILSSFALEDPSLAAKYPELAGDEDFMNLDLTTRSQPSYKQEFQSSQRDAAARAIEAIAKSTIPDARVQSEFNNMKVTVRTKDPTAAERFVEEVKSMGYGEYLSYTNSRLSFDAAQRGTYIVGPLRNAQSYKVFFNLVEPNWWRGVATRRGTWPS